MANKNFISVYDFETLSVNPETCEVVSLGAVIIHHKKLEVVEGAEFYSLIRPEDLNSLETEEGKKALSINKLDPEELRNAPSLETVWKNFVSFLDQYKTGKNAWGAPVAAGWNIKNFDNVIVNRLCKRFKNVDTDGRANIFHPRDSMDMIDDMFRWFEGQYDVHSYSFDNMRAYFGLEADGQAHHALTDCKDAAKFICRFMKFYRGQFAKMNFKGAFDNAG